jgi:hypothetical protein
MHELVERSRRPRYDFSVDFLSISGYNVDISSVGVEREANQKDDQGEVGIWKAIKEIRFAK